MKKSLLLTTALVATITATNVYAQAVIIDESKNNASRNDSEEYRVFEAQSQDLSSNNLIIKTEVHPQFAFEITEGKKIELSNTGSNERARIDMENNAITMKGGEVFINGDEKKSKEPGLHGNGVNISGGTININNGSVFDDSKAGASGFKMSNGTIKMNAKGSFIGSSQGGNVNITGGTIEVNGGSSLDKPNIAGANVIIGNTSLSGGKLDIKNNSNLIVISKDSQIQKKWRCFC